MLAATWSRIFSPVALTQLKASTAWSKVSAAVGETSNMAVKGRSLHRRTNRTRIMTRRRKAPIKWGCVERGGSSLLSPKAAIDVVNVAFSCVTPSVAFQPFGPLGRQPVEGQPDRPPQSREQTSRRRPPNLRRSATVAGNWMPSSR